MTKILGMIKSNKVLLQLLVGILIYGVLIQIIGLFVVKERWFFSYSLWVGILLSVFIAIHLQYSIEKALELEGGAAQSALSKAYLVRTVIILMVMGLGVYFDILSILPCFIGLMGLKAAAILQPKIAAWHSKS